MDFRKTKYILPNSFTLSSILAGFFSINFSMHATSVRGMTMAAWLIVVAMVCDLFDGRVARMTKAESELGIQLDSLADAISFGVAPAALMLNWGLKPLGALGIFIAFVFVACTVLRLARFNVMANNHQGVMRHFLGLPAPLAAGAVVSIVLADISVTGRFTTGASFSVAAMSLLLGGLMVSNVRYRTFKDVNFHGPAKVALLALVAATCALSILFKPSVAFVVLMVLYIIIGLGGGIVSLSKNFLVQENIGQDDFLGDFEPQEEERS